MEVKASRMIQVLKEPESLIVIVGIIASAILAYSGIRSNNTQQALTAILAILGALALSQILADYHAVGRDKQIEEILTIVQKAGASASPPLRSRTELPPLSIQAANAKDILIIGQSLGVALRQIEFFEERLQEGASIRLVMVDANNEAVIKAIGSFQETLVPDIQTSMEIVKHIAKAAKSEDQLEIRFIDFVPTLSLAAVDSHLLTGHIVVELVPYQISSSARPHLLCRASETPWFAYFRDVAERIWKSSSSPTGPDRAA